MTAVEEDTRMTRCHGEDSNGCVGEQRCLTHAVWDALGENIRLFLGRVSLADVLAGEVFADRGQRQTPGAIGASVTLTAAGPDAVSRGIATE